VELSDKKIPDLVDENYIYASVLYYFGIKFFDYTEETLAQVCQSKGLQLSVVVKQLESVTEVNGASPQALMTLPVDVILEYLRHNHHLFIKHRLPYISRLIENLNPGTDPLASAINDLKFVFPLFVEDFIHHIYEEEDTLFQYIRQLNHAWMGRQYHGKMYFEMEKYALQHFALEHSTQDDEMSGIRSITRDYDTTTTSNLHLKVVYAELQAFEKELILHAKIEDEVLFPKALNLEKAVKHMFASKVHLN